MEKIKMVINDEDLNNDDDDNLRLLRTLFIMTPAVKGLQGCN